MGCCSSVDKHAEKPVETWTHFNDTNLTILETNCPLDEAQETITATVVDVKDSGTYVKNPVTTVAVPVSKKYADLEITTSSHESFISLFEMLTVPRNACPYVRSLKIKPKPAYKDELADAHVEWKSNSRDSSNKLRPVSTGPGLIGSILAGPSPQLMNLQFFKINNIHLSDDEGIAIASHIGTFKNLREVELWDTRLTNEAALGLARCLSQNCAHMKKLELGENGISAKTQEDIEELFKNHSGFVLSAF